MNTRAAVWLGVWAALIVGSSGCEVVASIDDHVYDPKQIASAAQCDAYCTTIMKSCTGSDAAYSTRETCLGVCNRLPPGDSLEPENKNTVDCRKRQADLVSTTDEPSTYCRRAGPGGDGTCGSNCASYCKLLETTCPADYAELPNCEQQCAALRDAGEFDVVANHEGDTLQCRLVHVSSATVDPVTHCPHAAIHPNAPCADPPEAPPDCQNFCRFNALACAGDMAAYESSAQCLAVCSKLPAGTNADRTQNTMGCRLWHTYNALIDPESHCPHTAPGGDGHCGQSVDEKLGNCESYCILLEKACTAAFTGAYASQPACQSDCKAKLEAQGGKDNSGYRLSEAASGNTLQCRLLHVSRALSDPLECVSALGEGACQ